MKKLLFIALILYAGNVLASSLPNCPSDPSGVRHNCFGSINYEKGNYTGEWKNGRFHGKGSIASRDLNCFGNFKEGSMNGQATCTNLNGNKYIGEYKDNKMHGQGTFTWGKDTQWEGDKYIGEYKDSIKNGQGTYIHSNGDKYIGEFKDDKRHGQGTLTSADGSKFIGKFKDGYHQQGTFTTEIDGIESEYVGEFKNNIMHGRGTIKFNNIIFREGYFMNGDHVSDLCENMGLKKGSDPFGQCVVSLINEINNED